jgi:hypothetical protein
MKFNLWMVLIAGIHLSSAATGLQAPSPITQAKFLITPTTATQLNITNGETATIQYKVLNQTTLTRTLTMTPITGVSQITTGTNVCSNPFTLQPNASCLLTLAVNPSPTDFIISGVPTICKTQGEGNNNPSPFLCSQAAKEDQVRVTQREASFTRELSVTPSMLSLKAGGVSQEMIVTNHSFILTANNIAADFSSTALNGNLQQDASSCVSLAPQQSCSLIFTPGVVPVTLSTFPIKGDNTRGIGASMEILEPDTAVITVTGSPLAFNTNSSGTLTVYNTSSFVTATNISADLTGTALATAGVTQQSDCASVAPGDSCTLTFISPNNTPVPETEVVIQGTNSTTSQTNAFIAVNGESEASIAITEGSPMVLTAAGVNSTMKTMTIKNTSSTTIARNITVPFFPSPLDGAVELVTNTCAQVGVGESCELGFKANTAQAATTSFTIQGDNTIAINDGTITVNPINYAYIGNNSNNISRCDLAETGSLANCTVFSVTSGNGGSTSFLLNSNNTYAYAVNNNGSIDICAIAAVTGGLTCTTKTNTGITGNVQGGAISLDNKWLYVVEYKQPKLYQCAISADGSTLETCTASGASGVTNPEQMTINPDGTIIYIISHSPTNKAYQCPVTNSPLPGNIGACVDTGATNLPTLARAIAISSDNKYAYISGTDSITGCQVKPDASLDSCVLLRINPGILGLGQAIAINATNTLAYVTTYSTIPYLAQCNIANGIVSNCSSATSAPSGASTSNSVGLLQ